MRQMIIHRVQLFAAEVSIDVGGCLVHREMRAPLERFLEHLRSQAKERRVVVSHSFDLRPANLTDAEVIGQCKHLRRR